MNVLVVVVVFMHLYVYSLRMYYNAHCIDKPNKSTFKLITYAPVSSKTKGAATGVSEKFNDKHNLGIS